MCKTEFNSTGVGVRACGTETGVKAVDCTYAYHELVLGEGRLGLEWHEFAEYHIAEVIDLAAFDASACQT